MHGSHGKERAQKRAPKRHHPKAVSRRSAASRRVAEERRVTFSAALVFLAERGVKADREAQEKLKHSYRQYIKEQDPEKKLAVGDDLIRSIFGADSVA
jgi:hypothetical protein